MLNKYHGNVFGIEANLWYIMCRYMNRIQYYVCRATIVQCRAYILRVSFFLAVYFDDDKIRKYTQTRARARAHTDPNTLKYFKKAVRVEKKIRVCSSFLLFCFVA